MEETNSSRGPRLLDEHEKQVVRSGYGFGLRRGIQLKDDLDCAADVLQSWLMDQQCKKGLKGLLSFDYFLFIIFSRIRHPLGGGAS